MKTISNQRAVLETILYQVYVYNTIHLNWEFCTEVVSESLAEEWVSKNMEDGCSYRIVRKVIGIITQDVKCSAKKQ